jgi:hypothetical protein
MLGLTKEELPRIDLRTLKKQLRLKKLQHQLRLILMLGLLEKRGNLRLT